MLPALTSIAAALAQYNANSDWQTDGNGSAGLARQAIRYLLVNRAQRMGDQGSDLNFETLAEEKRQLEEFLNVGTYRANGRRRRVSASFHGSGLQ